MKPKESDFDKLGETYQGLPSLDARWRESIPRTLGTYELLAELGGGGFGAVFQCRHQTLRQERAIKVLDPRIAAEPGEKERFFREARVLAGLENVPEVVKIYDLSPADSAWSWLVMEYVPGMTMEDGHVAVTAAHALAWYKQLNGESRGMPEAMVKRIFQDVLRGLAAAHSQGIIHRDLKPGNILLTADGGAKLGDFGLVKLMNGRAKDKELAHVSSHLLNLPQSRPYMGTTAYMSPEQEEGKPLDARSDIYSLGLVIYELLLGHRAKGRFKFPHEKGIVADPWWDEVLEKMLEVNPGERFQDVQDVMGQSNVGKSFIAAQNNEIPTIHSTKKLNESPEQTSGFFYNRLSNLVFWCSRHHKVIYWTTLWSSLILFICSIIDSAYDEIIISLTIGITLVIIISIKRYTWHLFPIITTLAPLIYLFVYCPLLEGKIKNYVEYGGRGMNYGCSYNALLKTSPILYILGILEIALLIYFRRKQTQYLKNRAISQSPE